MVGLKINERNKNVKEKDSIIFYFSHYNIIKKLNNEQLGRLFRALFEKQLGNEVVLENDIEMAFDFINNQLLVDNEKYNQITLKRSMAGQRGGAPKGNKNACKNNKSSKTSKNKQNKLNDNENDNENDNDLFLLLEKEIKRTINQNEFEMIERWEGTFEFAVIKAAIEIAKRNEKVSIGYIDGILTNWKNLGKTKVENFKSGVISSLNNSEIELTDEQKEILKFDWLHSEEGADYK